jgi:hypothetical protein
MSDHTSPTRVAQPQAVVGPITLGRKKSGETLTIQPNSVIGPVALAEALGSSTISLIQVESTAAGVTITVNADGATQTISISGESVAGTTISFTSGSLLYAIARTESDLVLLSADGSETTYVALPIGSGTVTATFGALAT